VALRSVAPDPGLSLVCNDNSALVLFLVFVQHVYVIIIVIIKDGLKTCCFFNYLLPFGSVLSRVVQIL